MQQGEVGVENKGEGKGAERYKKNNLQVYTMYTHIILLPGSGIDITFACCVVMDTKYQLASRRSE